MDGQVTRPSERERASQTPYNLLTLAADDHAATTIIRVAEQISVATAVRALSDASGSRELLATGHSAGPLLGKLQSSRGPLLAHHRSKGKLEHLRELRLGISREKREKKNTFVKNED
jgi:hypothetical protein